MKDLKDILEGSLLADIEDTIETGNKYENISLTSLYNSKSKEEFEVKFKVFKSMIEDKNTEVTTSIKPKKTYIVFVKNISMKKDDTTLCRVSIFIGTTNDLYRLTWVVDDITGKDRMLIKKMETLDLDYFTRKYKYLESTIYVCPKKIKDEANKLIICNLE